MSKEVILDHLKQLHILLQTQVQPDSEMRSQLQSLTLEIQNVLNRVSEDGGLPAPESFSERIRVALLDFESKHPQISGLVERIADGLAGMGI